MTRSAPPHRPNGSTGVDRSLIVDRLKQDPAAVQRLVRIRSALLKVPQIFAMRTWAWRLAKKHTRNVPGVRSIVSMGETNGRAHLGFAAQLADS